MFESIVSLSGAAQQALMLAALTASSSLAFEAAVRGYRRAPPPPERGLEVTLAHTDADRLAADALVREQYRWRGYDCSVPDAYLERHRPGHVIVAREDGRIVGTLTLGLDSRAGLLVEASHAEAVGAARATGRRLGEVVRFAAREAADSRKVLARLFHAAHGLSSVHRLDELFIEVNPRHVGFYRRALCFEVAAAERICPRVGAPSVLMRLPLQRLSEKIGQIELALGA